MPSLRASCRRLYRMDKTNTHSYELVVIGGGPAGTSGAVAAGLFGHRVALVEKAATIGGAGLNSGTVPSKTLRETALALSGWQSRRLFGVDLSLRRETTVSDFTRHKDAVSEADGISEANLAGRREAIPRHASFIDPHTISHGADGSENIIHGDHILIATGRAMAATGFRSTIHACTTRMSLSMADARNVWYVVRASSAANTPARCGARRRRAAGDGRDTPLRSWPKFRAGGRDGGRRRALSLEQRVSRAMCPGRTTCVDVERRDARRMVTMCADARATRVN